MRLPQQRRQRQTRALNNKKNTVYGIHAKPGAQDSGFCVVAGMGLTKNLRFDNETAKVENERQKCSTGCASVQKFD